jgi:hypothetical protein
MVRRLSPAFAAAVLAASCLLAMPARARAIDYVPYDDERDSNYLKVMYHFVYPFGKAAELVFFRPLHTIAGLSQPDPDNPRDEDDIGACITFRPERKCSRGR